MKTTEKLKRVGVFREPLQGVIPPVLVEIIVFCSGGGVGEDSAPVEGLPYGDGSLHVHRKEWSPARRQ